MVLFQKVTLFLLRISLGWLMFYAGVSKVVNPGWSSKGYLMGAQTFLGFYQWLASPQILPVVDFLNVWGPTLLGISLLLGLFVRVSAPFGALMMVLYYFPILNFPKVGEHSFLVDEHVIYAVALMLLVVFNAGRFWGLDEILYKKNKPF